MSIIYDVIIGDTFESISRKEFGTEQNSLHIANANPGVVEPLTPGTDLIIPELPGAPKNIKQQGANATIDETTILINNTRFRFWDGVRITRSIDTMDTIEFGAPFDNDTPGFKEAFRPFSYQSIIATVGGTPIFTGTMLTPVPVIENNRKIISVSGYSLPGVLNDCTSPASAYPLEFNKQSLQEIVKTLVSPFGISVDFVGDQGAIFERVASDPGKRVLSFIVELAKQRNLIVASTPDGKLIIWNSNNTGSPVANFEQGNSPVLSITPFFNPQNYYSHVTGIEPVVVGLAGSQFTVKNARLPGVIRPHTFNAPDTINSTIKSAVEAKTGRMFGNMVSYSIRVNTWRDPAGNLWEPNTTVNLIAPDAMIYNNYEFIIRSIEFETDSNTQTATLNVVLPGSFSGELPNNLPWD